MSQGDDYKPTEYFNPQAYSQNPGGGPGAGWPGMVAGPKNAKTEVLRPQGPDVFAMLVVVEGPGKGQIFRLNPVEPNTIGREFTCDIPIDEPAVSRQHARIKLDRRENGELQYFIQDLATENGTEINGEQVLKHYLRDGDRIKLGRTVLAFKQV